MLLTGWHICHCRLGWCYDGWLRCQRRRTRGIRRAACRINNIRVLKFNGDENFVLACNFVDYYPVGPVDKKKQQQRTDDDVVVAG